LRKNLASYRWAKGKYEETEHVHGRVAKAGENMFGRAYSQWPYGINSNAFQINLIIIALNVDATTLFIFSLSNR
jgi:hypothetical protein